MAYWYPGESYSSYLLAISLKKVAADLKLPVAFSTSMARLL